MKLGLFEPFNKECLQPGCIRKFKNFQIHNLVTVFATASRSQINKNIFVTASFWWQNTTYKYGCKLVINIIVYNEMDMDRSECNVVAKSKTVAMRISSCNMNGGHKFTLTNF